MKTSLYGSDSLILFLRKVEVKLCDYLPWIENMDNPAPLYFE
jgi:hypothetical protein